MYKQPTENLNGALVNGYASSIQMFNGALASSRQRISMGHWLTLCKQHTDVQWCIGKQQAENLNGALVNGYANSRQRLNRVLVKGYTASGLNGVIGVPALLCCMVQKFLLVCGFYLNASLRM